INTGTTKSLSFLFWSGQTIQNPRSENREVYPENYGWTGFRRLIAIDVRTQVKVIFYCISSIILACAKYIMKSLSALRPKTSTTPLPAKKDYRHGGRRIQ